MKSSRAEVTHVQVTQIDIENGDRASLCGCPVARALIRKFQKQAQVPGGPTVYINHGDYSGLCDLYEISRSAQVKIAEFDMDGTMEPFEFDMEFIGTIPRVGTKL